MGTPPEAPPQGKGVDGKGLRERSDILWPIQQAATRLETGKPHARPIPPDEAKTGLRRSFRQKARLQASTRIPVKIEQGCSFSRAIFRVSEHPSIVELQGVAGCEGGVSSRHFSSFDFCAVLAS